MTTQTVLQYNGVRLQNVQTLEFIETPIMDDSGVAYMYTKTSLRVVGYFTLDNHKTIGVYPQLSQYPGSGLQQGVTQQFALIKQHLEMPRRRLVYSTLCNGSVGQVQDNGDGPPLDPSLGVPLFIIDPPKVDLVDSNEDVVYMRTRTDVHGGPYPKPVNITHVANNQVWRVEFAVEFATVPPCPYDSRYITNPDEHVPGESVRPDMALDDQGLTTIPFPEDFQSEQRKLGILSNRWSCTDQINENGYTTRVYTGKLTLANPNWNPSDFRAVTVPPVVPGMVRKSFDYVISEDNLSLRYTVTDQEARITPPWPAKTIKISHNEAAMSFGAKVNFTIRITLTADRKTSLYDLLLLAQAIGDQRLDMTANVDANNRASILLQRREFTTEQGSDDTAMLILVLSGERHPIVKNDADAPLVIGDTMSRAVTWRPVAGDHPLLANYNNVLSQGNRTGEQPPTEGGIPAISVLHAKLTTPCTQVFSTQASLSSSDEITERIRRIDDLESTYDTDNTYEAYPDTITIEINDNKANGPVETTPTYSSQHLTYMYSHYNITSSYGMQGLNVALPIARTAVGGAALPFSNVVVGIGPRQPTRKIKIEAERVGSPPRLPEPIETFVETAKDAASSSESVTNTLLRHTTHHNNPVPVADGTSLLYTSYIEMEYSQNRVPAKHRMGIPDYIEPSNNGSSPHSLTDVRKYAFDTINIYVTGALTGGWNH